MPRRAAKTDDNHQAIVSYLRLKGWSVRSLASLGDGIPDLLVSRMKFTALVEVKDGDKSPSQRKLTPKERAFLEDWPGVAIVALSPEDALIQLEKWRSVVMRNGGRSVHI